MLIEIGTIVAVYAIARLIQIPIEFKAAGSSGPQREAVSQALAFLSVVAILVIGYMLYGLWSHQGQGQINLPVGR